MKTFVKNHRYHFILLFFLLLASAVSAGYLRTNLKTSTETKKQTTTPANTVNVPETTGSTGLTIKETLATTGQLSTSHATKTESAAPATFISATTSSISPGQMNRHNPLNQNLASAFYVNEQKYGLNLPESSTVYQAMNWLSQQTNFTFSGRQYASLGFFVEEINGLKNDPKANKYWIYYINGQSAKVGVSSYIIKPGDIIKWKYTNI